MGEKQIMEDARRLLEIEWRSKYFSRGTTLQLEDYIAENLDRGKHDADRLVRMMRGERTIEDEENQMRDWEIEEMEKEEAEILAEECFKISRQEPFRGLMRCWEVGETRVCAVREFERRKKKKKGKEKLNFGVVVTTGMLQPAAGRVP